MFSINKLLSKGHAAMTASGAAFFLSIAIISSASAADVTNIATTYDNSCAACHDSGALNAIKKKAPIINKTIEILNTTEKYDDRSLLFLEIAN